MAARERNLHLLQLGSGREGRADGKGAEMPRSAARQRHEMVIISRAEELLQIEPVRERKKEEEGRGGEERVVRRRARMLKEESEGGD